MEPIERLIHENAGVKEATEAIQTVIARYGYAPEFSGFRKQVGAVVSANSNIPASAFKTEALTAQKDALNGADAGILKKIIQNYRKSQARIRINNCI